MSWVNYDDVLEQIGADLLVDHLEVDTDRPRRCRARGEDHEKRGWYWLSTIHLDEDDGTRAPYIVGAFGVYHGNDNGKIKLELRRDGKRRTVDREQRAAINARLAEQQKRLKAQRRAEQERAAAKANGVWRAYRHTGESAYLARKGVANYGGRFDPNGNGTLALPMQDTRGRIWGLQLIRGPNRPKHKLEKEYFPRGLAKQGHFAPIGGIPRRGDVLLIAEGYATAASLHQATGLKAAVAFDAGNLRPVAQSLHLAYPGVRFLICADDDYRTAGNPGTKAATEAAHAVGGHWLAPVFAAERPMDGKKGPTDFNDLAHAEGLPAVRAQVEACLDAVGWSLRNENAARTPSIEGSGDGQLLPVIPIDEAARRWVGTYGMGGKTLYDRIQRKFVHVDDVRNLLGAERIDKLRMHPDYEVADVAEIGFDPTEREGLRFNTWGGWPSVPSSDGICDASLDLLAYLCNGEGHAGGRALYEHVLKWLAYPIQHPGAKMQTAMVVHGPQGTGKSLVFEAVCKIYGEYGTIIGQESIEDKYNSDWTEKKLFVLADEVVARTDTYHIKNRLKGLVTGDKVRVNPKFVAAHVEKNCMNFVFLSNEDLPLALEKDDRRHIVIWTPPKLPEAYYAEVTEELRNGGIAALHHYLLNLDLGDFKPWTKPPMTAAKGDLIDLGMSSEQRFLRDWQRLELEGPDGEPLPFCPCLGSHLYRAYERWCKSNGEFRPRPSNHFTNHLGKQIGWTAARSEATWSSFQDQTIKKRKMITPSAEAMAGAAALVAPDTAQARLVQQPGETKTEWLTRGYFAFATALSTEDYA